MDATTKQGIGKSRPNSVFELYKFLDLFYDELNKVRKKREEQTKQN